MKQEGKNNWFLDWIGSHSGFYRICGISLAFPYGPECKQEPDMAQGPSQPVFWTQEGLGFETHTQQACVGVSGSPSGPLPHLFGSFDHTHNEVELQQCLCSTPNDVPTLLTKQLLCLMSK